MQCKNFFFGDIYIQTVCVLVLSLWLFLRQGMQILKIRNFFLIKHVFFKKKIWGKKCITVFIWMSWFFLFFSFSLFPTCPPWFWRAWDHVYGTALRVHNLPGKSTHSLADCRWRWVYGNHLYRTVVPPQRMPHRHGIYRIYRASLPRGPTPGTCHYPPHSSGKYLTVHHIYTK